MIDPKIKAGFDKVRKEMNILSANLKRMEDNQKQLLDLLQEKRQEVKKKPYPKKKIFRSTTERRGKKRTEIVQEILKTIDANKDLCTIEIEEKILNKGLICRATFYNYLRSLKDRHIIEEKQMGANKGYVVMKEK